MEQQIRKVKEDYDKLQQKINEFDFAKNTEMEEMRIKLEDSHFYQIENLKAAYNTQVSVLTTFSKAFHQIVPGATERDQRPPLADCIEIA